MMTITSIKLCNFKVQQLEAENAALREEVAQLACAPSRICKVQMLEAELAAAQATIARQREALEQFAEADLHPGNCASLEVATKRIRHIANKTLSAPTNLDALHEDRARTLERIAEMMGQETIDASVLLLEAQLHRARKEGE